MCLHSANLLLQVSFAAKGTELTAPPWMLLDALRSSGIFPFADCAEVREHVSLKATCLIPQQVHASRLQLIKAHLGCLYIPMLQASRTATGSAF